MLNPIIDWSTEEVWEFIHEYNVPYCKLYDEGYKRLGCIGCPMGSVENRYRDFERYPKYKQAYIRAFDRMIDVRNGGGIDRTCRQERKNCKGISTEIHELECDGLVQVVHEWETSDGVMKWWIK
jgi:3'-phosphoadenosine 5'-phosphosulfate sulfotransferase (PAPS reductase)/FAD synthetase